MKSGSLLDVIVRKGAAILELFSSEDETLLIRQDALVLYLLELKSPVWCKDYFAADVGHVRRRDSVVGSRSRGRARRREGRPRSAVGDEERERETRRAQKRN